MIMAPLWPWMGAFLAVLPVALAGHGDAISQKYFVEFTDSKTVRPHINAVARPIHCVDLLSYIVVRQLPLHPQ
jgi:hypothetical protein